MTRQLILAAIAALVLPLATIDTAEAKSTKQRQIENARFYEKARADNADPTYRFGAFPDWARFALSAKGHR